MSDITKKIEKALKNQDDLFLEDIIKNIPPRKYNPYFQWLMIGIMCYGNITLGKYKEFSKGCSA